MAEVSKKVLKNGIKLVTINEFRNVYAGGVSAQAINYAIGRGLIDYLVIGPRVRVIALTPRSLSYQPNNSPKRYKETIAT